MTTTGVSPIKVREADAVKVPALPRITGLAEWQQLVRDYSGSASRRPTAAFHFLSAAEQPDATYEALADSGDFESMDSKFAAALGEILNSSLRLKVKYLKNAEHKQGRLLKGRQIYWLI